MTPAQARTAAILTSIDATLSGVVTTGRSMWTTREIEDLLLDIRNEVQVYNDFDRFQEQVQDVANELKKGNRRGR